MHIGQLYWGSRIKGRRGGIRDYSTETILSSLLFISALSSSAAASEGIATIRTDGRRSFQYPWNTGATVCYSCASGNYSDHEGSLVCEACKPGRYWMPSYNIQYHHTHTHRTKKQHGNVAGTYNPYNGSQSCLECPVGTYSPIFGATSCMTCITSTQPGMSSCPPWVAPRELCLPKLPLSCNIGELGSKTCVACSSRRTTLLPTVLQDPSRVPGA